MVMFLARASNFCRRVQQMGAPADSITPAQCARERLTQSAADPTWSTLI